VILAKRSLWLALISGSVLLGLLNLPLAKLFASIIQTISQPEILLLATAVGLIPLIGGSLKNTGLMDNLVKNLKMNKKLYLMLAPALMGLLPIPGGALLSAPMMHNAGREIKPVDFAVINVWFRHIFILIYPLGALLPCTKMADLEVFTVIPMLIPGFVIFTFLGYFFFLRGINGSTNIGTRIDWYQLSIPLLIIISAPVTYLFLQRNKIIDELALLIGVAFSLLLTFILGKMHFIDFKKVFFRMRPWNYFMIIIGIFMFLHIFQSTTISKLIADIGFSRNFLIIVLGAFLSLVTGRVQLPVSILVPIYLAAYGPFTVLPFVLMYFAIYLGYMISPIHPCVTVSLEYFGTNYKDFAWKLLPPTLIGFVISLIAAITLL
jgi:integral membrane protein (TIGR00529 family)